MVQAIRRTVTVQDGGRIEIPSSDLPPGAAVDVIVLVEAAPEPDRRLSDLIGAARGLYSSVEDADAYVRELREEWGERA